MYWAGYHAPMKREYDAIVVLGAALNSDGSASSALRRRARHGVALHRSGAAPAILFSGGKAVNGMSEAQAMRDIALEMGIEPERMLLEADSNTTWENAHNSVGIARQNGWQRIVIVSDEVHLPRARFAFKKAGMEVGSSAPRVFDVPATTQFKQSFSEWAALAYYWLRSLFQR